MRLSLTCTCVLLIAACGGSSNSDDDDTQPPPDGNGALDTAPYDTNEFGNTTFTGVVWAPGQAPGMVPAGHEIPVSEAVVYWAVSRPADIMDGAHCEPCEAVDAVRTDAKGNFTLEISNPGTYWITIKKGLFRLDTQVVAPGGTMVALPPEQTTLPSEHDPANGKYIPRIALAEGLWDNVEDILGKMKIGDVDAVGHFIGSTAAGRFDMFENGSGDHEPYTIGTMDDLISNLAVMESYQIIFVPCSDGDTGNLFNNPAYRDNIRQFVHDGGKFYVTDWSAEWEDAVWPEFIEYGTGYDSPPGVLPPNYGDGNGFGNNEAQGRAMDGHLRDWLDGMTAPLTAAGGVGTVNPDSFLIENIYDQIVNNPLVFLGEDPMGMEVVAQAYPWVQGDWADGLGQTHPMTVTFEPTGCGRVLYSTYHTTDNPHQGLTPQERVLLYLIMELGVCKEGPIID